MERGHDDEALLAQCDRELREAVLLMHDSPRWERSEYLELIDELLDFRIRIVAEVET